MPEQERRIILQTDAEALRTGKPVEFDFDRQFPDGMRKIRIIKSPIQDIHGQVSGVLLIVEDVTEKARIRRQWEESRTLLQRIVDNLPQAITVKDRDGRYILANIVAARFRGITPDQYLGRTVNDMRQSPENIQLLVKADRQVLESGAMQIIPEMKFAGTGREHVWRRTFKIPLKDESGAVANILTVHEDLSAIRRMEEKRLELERRTAQSRKLESLGVMAGGIAHDFNNLLTTISGSAELLVSGLPPGDALVADAQSIVRASQAMAEMIRQMLTFSQNESLRLRRVDLNAALQGAGGFPATTPPKHIDVRYELAANLPAVEGDPNQLNRVVANLLANAVEAMGSAPGTITVSTGVARIEGVQTGTAKHPLDLPEGEYVYFQVADTGVGMSDAVKSRVFEPFFSTKFKGRGMGMAAANGIVRSHQGTIVIDSQPGRGTTMRVLLPRAKEEGPSERSLDLDPLQPEAADFSLC
jgi:PAS domain S-box-containing protein